MATNEEDKIQTIFDGVKRKQKVKDTIQAMLDWKQQVPDGKYEEGKESFSKLLDYVEAAFGKLNKENKQDEQKQGCLSFLYAKNKPRYTSEEKRQIKRLKNLYLGLIIAARDEASAEKSDRPAGKENNENNLDTLKEKAGKSELLKTNRSNLSFFQRDPTSSIRKVDKINLTRADSFIARIKNCLRFR